MEQIGRYKILKEVGRGALGVVYAATDPLIGRTVAVKTIQISACRTGQSLDELRQRLYREARSAGALSHPAIVTIYDMGEQGDEAYIVMEFVEGTTLEKILSSNARQHTSFFLDVIKRAAYALDYAHAKGIIHRDIKPSNLMICADETVKITDFGIAKISQSNALTHTGIVVGTPNYMSPEQAQGRQVDGRSDQFSLAVVAFQMLARKLPFDGPSLTAVLSKILWEEPDYRGTNIGKEVQAVLQKALSKNTYLRYPSCSDFAHNLQEAWERQKAEPPVADMGADAAMEAQPVAQAQTATEIAHEALTSEVEIPTTSGGYDAAGPAGLSTCTADPEAMDASAVPLPGKFLRAPAGRAVIGATVLVALVIVFTTFLIARRNVQAPPADTAGPPTPVAAVPLAEVPAKNRAPQSTPQTRAPAKTQGAVVQKSNASATPASTLPAAAPAAKTPPRAPATGIISWSGQLGKNSVLVITKDGPSYGKVVGLLPGVPVKLEVEPQTLEIRESPGENNSWSRLMLYTGRAKCSSITIRWTAIK